jgi:hypothetical protein
MIPFHGYARARTSYDTSEHDLTIIVDEQNDIPWTRIAKANSWMVEIGQSDIV